MEGEDCHCGLMVKWTVKCGWGRMRRWVDGEVDSEVWRQHLKKWDVRKLNAKIVGPHLT